MNAEALGMIETRGLVAAIEAADSHGQGCQCQTGQHGENRFGVVTVMVRGDVGAVKAAVEAGNVAAGNVGEVVSCHVIPRPHTGVDKIISAE